MQLLRLDELPSEGLAIDGPVDPGVLRDDRDREIPSTAVRAVLWLARNASGFQLAGTVRGRVELECVRCLERFDVPLEATVNLRIVEKGDEPVTASDASRFDVEQSTLDLGSVVREQLYLSLPLKPICRTDCRGLCPTCGRDRNRIQCGCTRAGSDDRWAPLRQLRLD